MKAEIAINPIPPFFEVDRLTVGYDRRNILENVSFHLSEGDSLVIIGQNGSGKSTLLKAITGVVPLKNGSIKLLGKNLKITYPHTLVNHDISYFLQGGLIMPRLTVQEHLELSALQCGTKLLKTHIDSICYYFPRIWELKNHLAGNLSGGERQMLSFSILIIQDRKLWLLDEPTQGLSSESIEFSIEFLNRRNREEGTTLILVEHNMDVAFRLASQIMIVKEGTVTRKFSKFEFQEKDFLIKFVYN